MGVFRATFARSTSFLLQQQQRRRVRAKASKQASKLAGARAKIDGPGGERISLMRLSSFAKNCARERTNEELIFPERERHEWIRAGGALKTCNGCNAYNTARASCMELGALGRRQLCQSLRPAKDLGDNSICAAGAISCDDDVSSVSHVCVRRTSNFLSHLSAVGYPREHFLDASLGRTVCRHRRHLAATNQPTVAAEKVPTPEAISAFFASNRARKLRN